MTQPGLTFRPVRHLEWLVLAFSFLFFLVAPPSKSAARTTLFATPVFLIAAGRNLYIPRAALQLRPLFEWWYQSLAGLAGPSRKETP